MRSQVARQAGRRARGAKGADFLDAVEIFADAVADRFAESSRKKRVERGDVVADQRALVGGERGLHLGARFGIVDDHRRHSQLASPIGALTMPVALERVRDAQHDILAPGRADDLHADRQRTPSVQTGTATTGRPMNEIGWV